MNLISLTYMGENNMRKNKLIELLQSIEGNPEIFLWNGIVADIMPVSKVIPSELYKEKFEFFHRLLNMEELNKGEKPSNEDEARKIFEADWDLDEPFETIKKNYNKKKVIIIEPKERGKKTWSRGCNFVY